MVPDGFILPFKTDGAIKFLDISQDPALGPYVITDDSTGKWLYNGQTWMATGTGTQSRAALLKQ